MKHEEYTKAWMELRRASEDLHVLFENEEPREELLMKCYQVRTRCLDIIKYCEQKGIKIDLSKL